MHLMRERETETETDRQTDRQNRQTDRQTDRQRTEVVYLMDLYFELQAPCAN